MNKEIRVCEYCNKPMQEWYIYWGNTYCSWDCLPIAVSQFEADYTDDGDDCWTEWESIYLDD